MQAALEEARRAEIDGEVPVGAVVVHGGEIISRGRNQIIGRRDPTAHAEFLALQDAGKALGNERLVGATVYVTLEPCLMCVGALILARVERVVFGTPDPKTGALGSTVDALKLSTGNHRFAVTGGVLADDSARLLRSFFQARRRGGSRA